MSERSFDSNCSLLIDLRKLSLTVERVAGVWTAMHAGAAVSFTSNAMRLAVFPSWVMTAVNRRIQTLPDFECCWMSVFARGRSTR